MVDDMLSRLPSTTIDKDKSRTSRDFIHVTELFTTRVEEDTED